jgi:hypothetical protein
MCRSSLRRGGGASADRAVRRCPVGRVGAVDAVRLQIGPVARASSRMPLVPGRRDVVTDASSHARTRVATLPHRHARESLMTEIVFLVEEAAEGVAARCVGS